MNETQDGSVDIALFARVVTSDPNRQDGARSTRLEEFRPEDVFLTSELVRGQDGAYEVPEHSDGRRCIGLEWAERRVLTETSLRFADAARMPATEAVAVQYWSSGGREDSWGGIGQTFWQGQWETFPGLVEKRGDCWVVAVAAEDVSEFEKGTGVLRIRWVLPAGIGPVKVLGLTAMSVSKWTRGTFRLEGLAGQAPTNVTLHIYNGLFLDADDSNPSLSQTWQPPTSRLFDLRYAVPSPSKGDRTLIRFEFSSGGFSVAIEDLLNTDVVFVKDYGILAARQDNGISALEYRDQIAEREGILQRVRKMPDQTFEQAMHVLHRPVQNNGPTMLSLACDNRKFIVDREGTIHGNGLTVTPHFWTGKADLLRMDFGEVGLDTTVRPHAKEGLPLRIGDTTYTKGIGLHANAELLIPLEGRYQTFEADLGVFPSDNDPGSVVFHVEIDGKNQFTSDVMRPVDAMKRIHIPVAGARQMVLRLTDAGDGITNDAGNLGDARLVPANAASANDVVYLSDLLRSYDFTSPEVTRRLDGEWFPIIVNSVHGSGLIYRQRTYVAPFALEATPMRAIGHTKPLCVSEIAVENPSTETVAASIRVAFSDEGQPGSILVKRAGRRLLISRSEKLLACTDSEGWEPEEIAVDQTTIVLTGEMSPQTTRRFRFYIPAWDLSADAHAMLPGNNPRARVEQYWRDLLDPAMQVELPEPLVENVYRATQVHCMIAARNTANGDFIEPWISSTTYGPLDTEAQAVVLGMDLAGHHEFARRSTDMFIHSYNEQGMLAKGYTLMGLGQHLWTLGEHYALTPDISWLERMAPKLLLASRWIARQAEKTVRTNARGERAPEYGLVPPGVLADWNRYAYYMYANAHFQAGLAAVSRILADVNHPEAAELLDAAGQYRKDILCAYDWNQARMPVVPLRDGSWVPPPVSSLYTYGLTRDFFGGISAIGHDVEVGGNHLIPLGLIDAKSPCADWMIEYMEDRWFFIDGLFGAYPAHEAEQDWFNQAGFSKLQPHYTRTTDIHALRDDVKPFVRTYFNTFPLLLNTENLTYWEHFNNGGAWNKTHESGWFLEMTRMMLVMERKNELWLAPFVTGNWLKDGMTVAVRNAPTHFGKVSYRITSFASQGYISALIHPPSRRPPECVVLRLRHPDGLKMQAISVNDKPHQDFNPGNNTVRLTGNTGPIRLRVQY